MILDRLQVRLASWRNEGLYRQLHQLQSPMQPTVVNRGKEQRVFCASNYLGLANHPQQKAAMVQAIEQYGVGTGASHLVVGYSELHQQAEMAFARYYGFESAILFSCGYMANVGIQQALLSRHDTVFHDRLNHASLLDGTRLAGATLKRFRHRDYDQLESLLKESPQALVASDTVFSMQGDEADCRKLANLRQQYGATLLLDDAHGVGVMGTAGRGSLSQYGLTAADVDLYVCPLGKAFGSFGALVMGAEKTIDALRQFSRSYVYSTAMPAALAAVAAEALQIIQDEAWRHGRLRELIAYFKQAAIKSGVELSPSDSAIQVLVVGDNAKCCALSDRLLQAGILVTAIRQPTVPAGSELLRFTLNVGHTENDIDELMQVLAHG